MSELALRDRGVVLLNGEIWNYKELAAAEGFNVSSEYDLIWQLFQRNGSAAFARLKGMFGLVVVDLERDLIVAARDEIGIKPMFWGTANRGVALGSTIGSLAALGVDLGINTRYLTEYEAVSFGAAGTSPVSGANELLPGWTYSWNLTGLPQQPILQQFSQHTSSERDEGDTVGRATQILTEALIRCTTHCDDTRPVLMLSGGLDSSLLAYLLRDAGLLSIADFVFVGAPNSPDLPFARMVAEELDVSLKTVLPVTPLPDAELAAGGGYTDDRLTRVMAAIRRAIPEARVLICGEGSDELYAGYPWNRDPRRRLRSLVEASQSLPQDSLVRMRIETLRARTELGDSLSRVRSELLDLDRTELLQRHHLLPLDQTSMHFGMELRVPYLDTDHWRFARQLPASKHWQDGSGKYIVKQSLLRVAPALTPEFLHRPKVGLPTASRQLATEAPSYSDYVSHYVKSLALWPPKEYL